MRIETYTWIIKLHGWIVQTNRWTIEQLRSFIMVRAFQTINILSNPYPYGKSHSHAFTLTCSQNYVRLTAKFQYRPRPIELDSP